MPIAPDVITAVEVKGYGDYTCTVMEIYCRKCDLFLGHMFEDAREKGDVHANAHWRH